MEDRRVATLDRGLWEKSKEDVGGRWTVDGWSHEKWNVGHFFVGAWFGAKGEEKVAVNFFFGGEKERSVLTRRKKKILRRNFGFWKKRRIVFLDDNKAERK